MKYRIGFRNGMVVTIDANKLIAVGHNDMRFLTADGKNEDQERYVKAIDVVFIAPVDSSHVERGAVALIPDK